MSQWQGVWKGMKGFRPSESTYMFKYYEELLGMSDLKNKKILEIGCGTGVNTLLMALRGAKVTLLDYEKKALEIAKKIAEELSVDAEFLYGDMFEYDFGREFDIVHSEGVVEHFLGEKRQRIIDIHSQATVRGGKCVIIVPNSSSPPYRIGKFIAEKTKTWIHGNEYPYIKKELVGRMKKAGLDVEKIIGGEFLLSFIWLFSPLWLPYYNKFLSTGLKRKTNGFFYKLNYNNFFADRWGRVIGIQGIKR